MKAEIIKNPPSGYLNQDTGDSGYAVALQVILFLFLHGKHRSVLPDICDQGNDR